LLQRVLRPAAYSGRAKIKVALVPPKPKEFDIATLT